MTTESPSGVRCRIEYRTGDSQHYQVCPFSFRESSGDPGATCGAMSSLTCSHWIFRQPQVE